VDEAHFISTEQKTFRPSISIRQILNQILITQAVKIFCYQEPVLTFGTYKTIFENQQWRHPILFFLVTDHT